MNERVVSWLTVAILAIFSLSCAQPAREVSAAEVEPEPFDSPLERGQYMLETERQYEAVAAASTILVSDGEDVDAHFLLIEATGKYVGDVVPAETLAAEYEVWADRRGHDPIARVVLAKAIRHTLGRAGSTDQEDKCARIAELVQPVRRDPVVGDYALAVLVKSADLCPVDAEALIQEMPSLGDLNQAATNEVVEYLLEQTAVDADTLGRLEESVLAGDGSVRWAQPLWSREASGPKLKRARVLAVRKARREADSARLDRVYWAWSILRAAADRHQHRAFERISVLDPTCRLILDHATYREPFFVRTNVADNSLDPGVALERLAALEPSAPETGEARRVYDLCVLRRLAEVGNGDALLATATEVMRRHPDDLESRYLFVRHAIESGAHHDAALDAIDEALRILEQTEPLAPWNDQMFTGRAGYRQRQVDFLRDSLEALDPSRSLPADDEVLSPRMAVERGLALAHGQAEGWEHNAGNDLGADDLDGQGRDSDALAWLLYGLTWGEPPTDENQAAVRDLANQRWMPAGLSVYLESRRDARSRELERIERAGDAEPDDSIGKPFPELVFMEGEERRTTADLGPDFVLETWATWCKPCVVGMSGFGDVAAEFPDLPFVALAVLDSAARVASFFEGSGDLHYRVGILDGASYNDLLHEGVPTVYLVADGLVADVIWGSGAARDDRLRESIRRVYGAGDRE
jgi:thiol-disulfide isomerase/thioredoxin